MHGVFILRIVALSLLWRSGLLHGESPGTFRDCSDCPEMVSIAGGSFTMGVSAAEEERESVPNEIRGRAMPEHVVTLGDFALGKYAVTRGEFAAFVRDTDHQTGDACYVVYWDGDQWKAGEQPGYSWRNPNFAQTDRHPAVCINWDDARAYVAWLSKKTGHTYRLPSEAEWEYAARAGSGAPRLWGDDHARACSYANVGDVSMRNAFDRTGNFPCSDGYTHTAPVGEYPPNAFGLYDMQGNVWQWVQDCWNESYRGAPMDGSAWEQGECGARVERGGSWYSFPWMVNTGFRYSLERGMRKVYLGFRVARAR